jgi:uncharacterized SAM-binding protein YcdF (DUF218 family)
VTLSSLVETFKAYLLPGSLSLLLLLASLGTILLFARTRWSRIGRWGLAAVLALYWLMALPFVAHSLSWTLGRGYRSIQSPSEAQGSQALVILGGGAATYEEAGAALSSMSDASALRALEGARLYRLLDPPWVIVSGGPSGPRAEPESAILRRAMIQLGVPSDRILEEATSGNTYEQAVNVRVLLLSHSIHRFVLVTSMVHMPRAVGVFRHVGLSPIPSPAPDQSETPRPGLQSALPSLDALHTSQGAMREVLGLIYYGVRGWLSPAVLEGAPASLGLPTRMG